MKLSRAAIAATTLSLGTLVTGALVAPAAAAATITVCAAATECAHTTIQEAVTAAQAGDTIEVSGPLTVAGQTTINKDVTVTGAPGATVTQTATAITFLLSGDGVTLSNLTITSDAPYATEFVQIGGDDVTLSGNTIYAPAQALPMSTWITARAFVPQGSARGLTVVGNTFHSLRAAAYLNPGSTGTIADNTVYNTKGDFNVDNADFTFTGNRAGDDAQPSEWGIVIYKSTDAALYRSVEELSRANNNMTVWDQRSGEKYVVPTTAADCKNGAWKNRNPEFRTQGECVKFVYAGK